MSFLNSIKNNSKQYNFPFNHWEYSNALSEEAIDEIVKADIPDVSKHNLNYDGTRAIDGGAAEFREGIASGGKAIKFRCFINKENSTQFPNLVKFINELQSKETYETISKMIDKAVLIAHTYTYKSTRKHLVITTDPKAEAHIGGPNDFRVSLGSVIA